MSDVKRRIEALPLEKRKLLDELLQKKSASKQKTETIHGRVPALSAREHFDLMILGGGLAGLTLARQVRLARPQTRIAVAEKRSHPAPEAAFKVGESTVEAGAFYLREILGLEEHLTLHQLPKAGLRFFFPAGDKNDIARRVEVGGSYLPPVRSYQLDRGRFENMLRVQNSNDGIMFWDECRVEDVALGDEKHFISLKRRNERFTISSRWLVDASGRAGILKRRLGLEAEVNHNVNAVWFRIDDVIDLDDWAASPDWLARVPRGLRRLSTNHLMDRGYWVWLIPLASGSTSVGIVADAELHAFNQMNRFDRALDWLRQHEPQCAEQVYSRRNLLQDFLALKHYAHGCKQVMSADRWCLTGEAGVFTDPFYSPGSDFIGMGNTYISDLIVRELGGERIDERAAHYNRLYLNSFETVLTGYERQYPIMGNAQVMTVKIVWDFLVYWASSALLIFHRRLCDLEFMASIGKELQRTNHLNARVQTLLRDWDRLDCKEWEGFFVDLLDINFLEQQHRQLVTSYTDETLRATIITNLALLESVATEIFRRAARALPGVSAPRDINPYGISMSPDAWEVDELFSTNGEARPDSVVREGFGRIWFDLFAPGSVKAVPEHGAVTAMNMERR